MKSSNDNFLEGIHFYYNENSLLVFTEKYHLQRGYCCGNGCRHCPFNYGNVEEPIKSKLLAEKNKNETKQEEAVTCKRTIKNHNKTV